MLSPKMTQGGPDAAEMYPPQTEDTNATEVWADRGGVAGRVVAAHAGSPCIGAGLFLCLPPPARPPSDTGFDP